MTNKNLGSILEPTKQCSVTRETLIDVCHRYIESLDEHTIYTLCWNGSLWIDERAVLNDHVTVANLHALGPRRESWTREIASDVRAVVLTDFDGMAERFVLETDEDDDGNPIKPGNCQILYSTDVGRQELKECIRNRMEGDFDSLMYLINEAPEFA